jgi:hypothetical protein
MRNRAAVGVGVAGIVVAIGAFLLGLISGAESATVSVVRDTPNVHCYQDTSPPQRMASTLP